MRVIKCDRCGTIISNKESIKHTCNIILKTDFVGVFDEKHVCNKCKNKLYKWFENKELEE